MPRLPLHPASGTGIVTPFGKAIRMVRYGCTNRPFYHIIIIDVKRLQKRPPIEQVGTYDPIPNIHNEKLVSFNFERIQYWFAKGAQVSKPVADLLGLAGFLPVHPRTYMRAWRNRKIVKESASKDKVRLELTTPALLTELLSYKYRALTDCATGDLYQCFSYVVDPIVQYIYICMDKDKCLLT